TAHPPRRTTGPSRAGRSRTEQRARARPGSLAGPVLNARSGWLHRALRTQRHPPGSGKRRPLVSITSRWPEVGQALGNERTRHDAAGLERNTLAPGHDQTAGLARAEPGRKSRAQERGGLHHVLRQLRDVSAEVSESRLDVDRARSRQRRGGGNRTFAGEKGVGEDPDVGPWTAEGVGAKLRAVG